MFNLNAHLFVFCLSLVGLLFEEEGLYIVVLALFVGLLELFLWARREQRAGKLNWCHPVPVFALGYLIVYYQLPFCYLAGFELSYHSYYVIFAPQNISYCVMVGAMGLASFFCGEQIYHLKRKRISTPPIATAAYDVLRLRLFHSNQQP